MSIARQVGPFLMAPAFVLCVLLAGVVGAFATGPQSMETAECDQSEKAVLYFDEEGELCGEKVWWLLHR